MKNYEKKRKILKCLSEATPPTPMDFTKARAPITNLVKFSIHSSRGYAKAASKAADPKAKLIKEQNMKKKAKQLPSLHPLYMEVPKALKYLRAAEVGQPAKKTTISINIKVIPEKGSVPLRGTINYAKAIKDNHLLVFTGSQKVIEEIGANNANVTIGGESLIADIKSGKVKLDDFDQCFASPDILNDLKPIARILGPKNLMPSTKRNTVSTNLAEMIEQNFNSIEFKQKGYNIGIPVGRCDFSDFEILTNLKIASKAIYDCHAKNSKKPNIIGQTLISSTLGPAIAIDIRP